jgi:bifunctional NMN adenylyltransferase/nudix hydrolase
MSQKSKKLSVYMGRFSAFHRGHASVALRSLKSSEAVLVIIGSANQPRKVKNPWYWTERAEMILAWYQAELAKDPTLGKLIIKSIRDWPYNNDLWLAGVQTLIDDVVSAENISESEPIYIAGADRDSSTFYLKMFPKPKYVLDLVQEDREVSEFLTATKIREMYFGNLFNGQQLSEENASLLMNTFLPKTSIDFLNQFRKTKEYDNLVSEFNVIQQRKAAKKVFPYAIKDQTVDAVVIQSGNILLVKRRAAPGKGLWALPGGHLDEYEWMLDGAVRELYEETKIDVPKEVLYGSVLFDQRFEHPDRSEVGRVISQAFCFKLPDAVSSDGQQILPSIKGSDDAEKAKWFPISKALEMSDRLFDDHHAIIEIFVSRLTQENLSRTKKLK